MLTKLGFIVDPSVEPKSVGGEGFRAENCVVTVRLHGQTCELRVQLDNGHCIAFTQQAWMVEEPSAGSSTLPKLN